MKIWELKDNKYEHDWKFEFVFPFALTVKEISGTSHNVGSFTGLPSTYNHVQNILVQAWNYTFQLVRPLSMLKNEMKCARGG